ncbi:MAG TPA: hypothetical protein PKH65_06005 [Bacteroidia bacterium]|nr:hypothetical protein [Bacteroidia bacterium]HNT80218.1 hypothetical protein [Bacteroidia bacterium]
MKRFLILVVVVMNVIGCTKDSGPYIILPQDSSFVAISFSNDIQPLFDNKCVSCHDANHPFLDLSSGQAYNELMTSGANAPYVDVNDVENSHLIERLIGTEWPIMPPAPPFVDNDGIDTVRMWISQGALNN